MDVETIRPEKTIGDYYQNVAIYARVSTCAQSQLHSLGNQISGLIEMVGNNSRWKLYDIYVDIESGRNPRKNLSRLISDCRDGKVDYILIKSVSRMYRDTVGLLGVSRELKDLGVNIHFVNENIDSIDPNGELTLTIVEAIAQAESETKSRNIKWGLKRAKDDNNSKYNSRLFYGYQRGEDGSVEINRDEAEVIKKIFTLYNEGLSVLKIIDRLYEEGIPSPKGAAKWSKEGIRMRLNDERYTGIIVKRIGMTNYIRRLKYPRIIEREVFNEAGIKRTRRSNVTIDENGNYVRSSKRYSSPDQNK